MNRMPLVLLALFAAAAVFGAGEFDDTDSSAEELPLNVQEWRSATEVVALARQKIHDDSESLVTALEKSWVELSKSLVDWDYTRLAVNVAINAPPLSSLRRDGDPLSIPYWGRYYMYWNDADGRTVEEVIEALDRAIAFAHDQEMMALDIGATGDQLIEYDLRVMDELDLSIAEPNVVLGAGQVDHRVDDWAVSDEELPLNVQEWRSVAEVVEFARRKIHDGGWYQVEAISGLECLATALQKSWMELGKSLVDWDYTRLAINVAINAPPWSSLRRDGDPLSIPYWGRYYMYWNDANGRTVEEVIEALDRAIAFAHDQEMIALDIGATGDQLIEYDLRVMDELNLSIRGEF